MILKYTFFQIQLPINRSLLLLNIPVKRQYYYLSTKTILSLESHAPPIFYHLFQGVVFGKHLVGSIELDKHKFNLLFRNCTYHIVVLHQIHDSDNWSVILKFSCFIFLVPLQLRRTYRTIIMFLKKFNCLLISLFKFISFFSER